MRWPLWRIAVAERSMEPALRPGDWLLVRRSIRPGRPPRIRPGQLVIARHPGGRTCCWSSARRGPRRRGWWLESDNPGARAVDSRSFGPVPPGLIEGRVLLRYWPVRRGSAGPAAAPQRGGRVPGRGCGLPCGQLDQCRIRSLGSSPACRCDRSSISPLGSLASFAQK